VVSFILGLALGAAAARPAAPFVAAGGVARRDARRHRAQHSAAAWFAAFAPPLVVAAQVADPDGLRRRRPGDRDRPAAAADDLCARRRVSRRSRFDRAPA
jgi:hypothetical protein